MQQNLPKSARKSILFVSADASEENTINKTHRPAGRCVFRSIVWLAVVEGKPSGVLLHFHRTSFTDTFRLQNKRTVGRSYSFLSLYARKVKIAVNTMVLPISVILTHGPWWSRAQRQGGNGRVVARQRRLSAGARLRRRAEAGGTSGRHLVRGPRGWRALLPPVRPSFAARGRLRAGARSRWACEAEALRERAGGGDLRRGAPRVDTW